MPCRVVWTLLIAVTCFLMSPSVIRSTGDTLEIYDCHHSPKLGGYHCHRGPLAWQFFASKEEILRTLERK